MKRLGDGIGYGAGAGGFNVSDSRGGFVEVCRF